MVNRTAAPPDRPEPDARVLAAISTVVGATYGDLDEAFAVIADSADSNPQRFAEAITATARERSTSAALSIINDAWLASLVVAGGRVIHADPVLAQAIRLPVFDETIAGLTDQANRSSRVFRALPIGTDRRAIAIAARAKDAVHWPLPPAARAALDVPGASAVLIYSPSYSEAFAELLERSFLLTRAEARVCGCLFDGATIEAAAARLRISPSTAREHVRTILRKTGSARRAELLARITELLAGDYLRSSERTTLLREAFGLTAAEARVADASALGLSVPEIARRDGVSGHTVRTQLDTTLRKSGAARTTDLARLVCELCALAAWTSCTEHRRLDQERLIGATRLIPAPGRRQIAAADYGPAAGEPVLYCPPGYCYRWVRRALADELTARGFRPLAVDPPDFGLTDGPLPDAGHVFDAAADDAARVLRALKIKRTHLFAEFGGSGPAMALAARHPDLVGDVVLLMPRAPLQEPVFPSAIQRIWQAFASAPALAVASYELLRTGGRSRYLRWIQTHISNAVEADRRAMADQDFVDERIGEMVACNSRTARGMIALDHGFIGGWQRPTRIGGRRWTILSTEIEPFRAAQPLEELWGWLPNVRFARLEGAGRLATHTHAAAIADCFVRSGA